VGQGLFLRTDHLLRGRYVIPGSGRLCEAYQDGREQNKGAHGTAPDRRVLHCLNRSKAIPAGDDPQIWKHPKMTVRRRQSDHIFGNLLRVKSFVTKRGPGMSST
jgi:hypothetical protein